MTIGTSNWKDIEVTRDHIVKAPTEIILGEYRVVPLLFGESPCEEPAASRNQLDRGLAVLNFLSQSAILRFLSVLPAGSVALAVIRSYSWRKSLGRRLALRSCREDNLKRSAWRLMLEGVRHVWLWSRHSARLEMICGIFLTGLKASLGRSQSSRFSA